MEQFERADIWEFDVARSTHDLLQQGLTEPFRSRIILSKEEFPDHDVASDTAALMAMGRGGMTTAVRVRI